MSVKLALGMCTQVKTNILTEEDIPMSPPPVHATSEYEDSLQAVHESLVLLKNNGVIPVKTSDL